MKRVFGIVSLLLATSLALAAASPALAVSDIAITSKNFPDKAMRKALQTKYDLDGDNVISVSEQKQLMPGLDLTECGISDATGIELFPYIEALDLGWNNIKKLDLRGNPNIQHVPGWEDDSVYRRCPDRRWDTYAGWQTVLVSLDHKKHPVE